MTLDLHWALNALFGVVLVGIGWFCRETWGSVQQMRRDLSALEVKIGSEYIRHDRLETLLNPIVRRLDQISEKLDHKQDRP